MLFERAVAVSKWENNPNLTQVWTLLLQNRCSFDEFGCLFEWKWQFHLQIKAKCLRVD